MKTKICLLLLLPLAAACLRDPAPEAKTPHSEEIYHGMIELGEKLEDPYTVENMRAALTKVYPTKAERTDISATDLYVRFLPTSEEQLGKLESAGLYLMDHPMDYRIAKEGDYYKDPELGEDAITWQYAVVPKSFTFPPGIRYELLDECYLSEHDPVTRAAGDIDWDIVEREAFRLTGNEDLLLPATKGTAVAPEGRISIEDPGFIGGQPFGVACVKVVCNIFVKIATTYTDRDGYYKMDKAFSGKPRYRLVFENQQGFKIGFNWIIIPASVSTLGSAGPEGLDFHVSRDGDAALFRRCTVNNAAYEYFTRCNEDDLDIAPPPSDLRLWIFPDLTCSSTCMLHHGAFLDHALLTAYIGAYVPLIKIFTPDITIGTREQDYAGIYRAVVHELAHASHYAQVGNKYWTPYITYVIRSFITEGWDAYGSGTGNGAGYCELGEMWGYFMQETMCRERYGGTVQSFGNRFWFKPDIFTYLYERGMSRHDIFKALTADVTGIDDLREQLISLYPDKEAVIAETFRHYGK